MKKLNNKGYMLVEIILASVLAFGVAYFIIDLTIKLKNKNDDLLVETEVTTDKTIITNKLMEVVQDERENFDCDKLTLSDNNTIMYDNKKIDIVNNYTDVADRDKWTCINSSGKIKVIIPLNVAQMSTKDYSVDIDYKYQWRINKVYIQIDMNGGALASKHGSEIGTSGSLITLNGSTIIHTIDYGDKLGKNGLVNYSNESYINITKNGYVAKSGSEWNTKPDGSGDSFNQTTRYADSKFCDASNGDCTVTLYVNWVKDTGGGYSGDGGCSRYLCCRNDNTDFCTYSNSGSMNNYTCSCWG